ncbi:uncharacterized protein LOC132722623 [Ruditapes philippinarum]|uniref:uncharacterized protein LOC132722623 n=1 Tax=Ruditapes philippinarum TaxID=129788 RepID=UPI00295B33E8|nr:uncharacterized protein LOC132722623 [Ruditapes philippinarum]
MKKSKRESEEKEIRSMSEIFTKNGDPQKFIYVVGDAGSGKSSFCKYLINCWCVAHSDGHNEDNDFEGVKEMKTFDFMFYISLRHNVKIRSVQEMLEQRYDKIEILCKLLENDSEKIIILLDGLDEWSFDSETRNEFQAGLPERDFTKKYTIVTTSRPWKIHSLRVSNREIHQLLKLKGFDEKHEKEMVKKTIIALNESLDPSECERKLKEPSLIGLKQVPIMLQQLICLWCDGKLDNTSRCAIYTGMLELYFTWNINKTLGNNTECMESSQNVELPQYLTDIEICRLNSHLIYSVSHLAYETLFNYPKNKSLTFDKSVFDDLKISNEVRETCLKLGILTEDKCPSFSVSKPKSSFFSFIHKSMQEFLAAVNIGIKFNPKHCSSDSAGNVESAKRFICKVFRKCSTVNDILEQSNVVIMLCGLEPRLATHVSKYIYDTVSEDSGVQEFRKTISRNICVDLNCITDIQKVIFESVAELNATCIVGSSPVFYIGDLVINDRENLDIVCSSIDQKRIDPDSVLSIRIYDISTRNVKFTKYLPLFHHFEKIAIACDLLSQRLSSTQSQSTQSNEHMINEINNSVSETIKLNTLTLKSLSFSSVYYTDKCNPMYKTVVSNLPSMINLVAIRMSRITMSHDDTNTFCNFLERACHLEQVHLEYVKCVCMKQHDINLSKHQQLQNLDMNYAVGLLDADTTNLEIFKYNKLTDSSSEKIFHIIRKSNKLKELELFGDIFSKSQLYHTNITDRLVRVLPLLHNLSKLELRFCRLHDNILQSPLEMKRLKNIKLNDVIMSLTTWQKFVDSLPAILHTVNVIVMDCYITGDGEECNVDMLTLTSRGRRKENDAISKQYVKDKDQLFHVKSDDHFWFVFTTRGP